MQQSLRSIEGFSVPVYTVNTVIAGSGAAGFNAADRLCSYGQTDICLVTDGVNSGTSRNTGSDKQTYYKLTLSGGDDDSVREMAETLFAGQCVDGDIALCEAALSAQSFFRLVELGVPFPRNRYGEFIGYKTDHDPRRRATSVGPYTSKCMTEALENAVRAKGVPIFDHMQIIRILTNKGELRGIICLNLAARGKNENLFYIFNCRNLILATGGPADMYADSVYPVSQYGATGLAFEAGAKGRNLTEWQYGLASINPRWNVSGTYMQVLPRFISTNADGSDEREFLSDFFADKGEMLSNVFMKGYQWPFDVRKVQGGSSIIDILVYIESYKGRKVYLDFRENSGGGEMDYSILSKEAREYLENAGACFGTPLERLLHMNSPAVDFYRDKGVDLARERLEIALCVQHNNGGLAVDCWWQTNIPGFFAAGEVSASHGVYRPGGSALNAGQVGSTRAAQHIAAHRKGAPPDPAELERVCGGQITAVIALTKSFSGTATISIADRWTAATNRMSCIGAAIRDCDAIREATRQIAAELERFESEVDVPDTAGLALAFRLRNTLICQYVYLQAMLDYVTNGGKSRGSALYSDPAGKKPYDDLPEVFSFSLDDGSHGNVVQEVEYINRKCRFHWRPVRPIPSDDDFFENVWRSFRENGNIY